MLLIDNLILNAVFGFLSSLKMDFIKDEKCLYITGHSYLVDVIKAKKSSEV